ncbi:MAG: PLP-dependent aminotransferase family protein [Rhizobiaceae bacterium]|nr:PLP-dependent aminotransferase family protein [Rhizobiaceae bacterium]
MSTDWKSVLPIGGGKRYQVLAEGLADAILSGRIAAGAQLPTHRDMAHRLGLSVSTVTRAYAELQSRGLLVNRVGSGSFVSSLAGSDPAAGADADKKPSRRGAGSALEALDGSLRDTSGLIDLSFNEALMGPAARSVQKGLTELLTVADVRTLTGSQPVAGSVAQREAGAAWLNFIGVHAHPDEIVLVPGSQGCLATVLMALCNNGDAILTEGLTWPGIVTVANIANVRIRPVAMDAGGLAPEDLDRACREYRPRLLYTMPTLHNPTSITASLERRKAIVAVAQKHDLTIVEDDAYGFLLATPLPSYFELLPEKTIYVTSLSKAVAASIRVGFVAARARLQRQLLPALRAITMMTSPIVAEIATRLINNGAAMRAAWDQSETLAQRQVLLDAILGPRPASELSPSMHRWFELDDHWDSTGFAAEAFRLGVSVAAGPLFSATPGHDPRAVRISLGGDPDDKRLKRALVTLAGLARGRASVRPIT